MNEAAHKRSRKRRKKEEQSENSELDQGDHGGSSGETEGRDGEESGYDLEMKKENKRKNKKDRDKSRDKSADRPSKDRQNAKTRTARRRDSELEKSNEQLIQGSLKKSKQGKRRHQDIDDQQDEDQDISSKKTNR